MMTEKEKRELLDRAWVLYNDPCHIGSQSRWKAVLQKLVPRLRTATVGENTFRMNPETDRVEYLSSSTNKWINAAYSPAQYSAIAGLVTNPYEED